MENQIAQVSFNNISPQVPQIQIDKPKLDAFKKQLQKAIKFKQNEFDKVTNILYSARKEQPSPKHFSDSFSQQLLKQNQQIPKMFNEISIQEQAIYQKDCLEEKEEKMKQSQIQSEQKKVFHSQTKSQLPPLKSSFSNKRNKSTERNIETTENISNFSPKAKQNENCQIKNTKENDIKKQLQKENIFQIRKKNQNENNKQMLKETQSLVQENDNQNKKPRILQKIQFNQLQYLKIQCENYFHCEEFQIVYFFQDNSTYFHYWKINELQKYITLKSSIKINTIQLRNQFKIPIYHRSIQSPDGKIYLLGGLNPQNKQNSLNSCYSLNWQKQQLEFIKSMMIPRNSFGISYLNNYIYVVGGVSENAKDYDFNQNPILNQCERYSISQNKWESISPLNNKIQNVSLQTFNQKLLAIGGKQDTFNYINQIEIYDLEQNKWSELVICHQGIPLAMNNYYISIGESIGAIQINDEEIAIFGGNYDQKNISSSMIIKIYQENNTSRGEVNYYENLNLPEIGSFWSVSFIQDNKIFALQNVQMQTTKHINYFSKKNILLFQNQQWNQITQ